MLKNGETRIFKGKGLFSSICFELKQMGNTSKTLLLSYYKNDELIQTFPTSGTIIRLNGKKLSLKYSGDAFGGPAFMTVDCKLLSNSKLEEMIREIHGG